MTGVVALEPQVVQFVHGVVALQVVQFEQEVVPQVAHVMQAGVAVEFDPQLVQVVAGVPPQVEHVVSDVALQVAQVAEVQFPLAQVEPQLVHAVALHVPLVQVVPPE